MTNISTDLRDDSDPEWTPLNDLWLVEMGTLRPFISAIHAMRATLSTAVAARLPGGLTGDLTPYAQEKFAIEYQIWDTVAAHFWQHCKLVYSEIMTQGHEAVTAKQLAHMTSRLNEMAYALAGNPAATNPAPRNSRRD